MKDTRSLEFGLINQRINALPDVTVGFIPLPRWVRVLHRIGWGVMVVVLSWPLLLWLGLPVQRFTAPVLWALGAMLVCFLPHLLWSLVEMYRHFRQGVTGFFNRFDHDLPLLRSEVRWLADQPEAELRQCLAEARFHRAQLEEKLRLLLGGMERLGILPLVVAVALAVANGQMPRAVPMWSWALGVFGALLWAIGWAAARFRLRLNLIAHLLEQALALRQERASMTRENPLVCTTSCTGVLQQGVENASS